MDNQQVQLILQLILAVFLGGVIGFEREYKKRAAGLQTYSLVTLGSCLFTIIAAETFLRLSGVQGIVFDPSRVILAVATGIGFIGAGVIIYRQVHIEGLTTAAGLWTAAAIGIAVGSKFYFLAVMSAILAVLILVIFGAVERRYFGKD